MKLTTTILCALIAAALTSPIVFAQINWTEHVIDPYFNGAWGVYPVDLDDDGDMDVLGAAIDADEIAWWKNDGSQNFTKHVIAASFNYARSVYAIDIDGDNDTDVLGAAGGIGGGNTLIYWWENDGNENFTEHVIDATFNGAYCVYAIDLDGDDDVDVLGAANADHEIAWWENDGDENFTYHKIDSLYYASWVYSTDLDGDNDIDVLGTSFYDGVFWWENDGQENFTVHAISGDLYGSSVYAIDMDNDTDIDVLATATTDDDVLWFENDGSQNFSQHIIDSNFDGAWNVLAEDMDHDGDVDVVGAAWADGAITWWENDGSQNFTEHNITSTFGRARRGYPIDIDDDGDMDVVGAGHTEDAITWWESDLGPAPGFIAGVVKEEDDVTPINSVEVSVYDSGDNLAGTDTTDLNGEFAFSLDPDIYYATFSKTGYNDTTLTDLEVVSAETTTVNLLMYTSGYAYLPGDVNMALGIWPPQCIGGDVTYLVGYFIGGSQASCNLDGFWASADINGDCTIIGGDVTALVGYFVSGGSLVPCPDYEPVWPPLPPEAPDGWPNCDTPVINSKVIPTGLVR